MVGAGVSSNRSPPGSDRHPGLSTGAGSDSILASQLSDPVFLDRETDSHQAISSSKVLDSQYRRPPALEMEEVRQLTH